MFLSLRRSAKHRRRVFNCIQVEVTSRCFLRCVMCPNHILADRWISMDMRPDILKAIVEEADSANLIYLSGWGEPLMRPDLPELVKAVRNAGTAAGFTTNGMLLDRGRARELLNAGLDIISISVAGATRETHGRVRVGSDLERIMENVTYLTALKRRLRTDEPKVVLLYLMLKQNVHELPLAVQMAHEIGADELVATNITYAPSPAQDEMCVFSCPGCQQADYGPFVREAEEKARDLGLAFRAYPLHMEEVTVCDEDPLHNTFVTADGAVGPCVYLNMMLEGPIPRSFCGKPYRVDRLFFGRLGEESLLDIWEGEGYVAFREAFQERLKALQELIFLKRSSPEDVGAVLASRPLPEPCTTCYKAYGL